MIDMTRFLLYTANTPKGDDTGKESFWTEAVIYRMKLISAVPNGYNIGDTVPVQVFREDHTFHVFRSKVMSPLSPTNVEKFNRFVVEEENK